MIIKLILSLVPLPLIINRWTELTYLYIGGTIPEAHFVEYHITIAHCAVQFPKQSQYGDNFSFVVFTVRYRRTNTPLKIPDIHSILNILR